MVLIITPITMTVIIGVVRSLITVKTTYQVYINNIFLSISFVVVSISMPMEVCSYACMHDIVLSRCSSTFVFVNKLYIHTHTPYR